MIVYEQTESLDLASLPRPRVVTLGVFDGLHLGHQHLVRRVVEQARAHAHARDGGSAVVFTFANHPLAVLAPPYAPKQLLSPERKARMLERMGVDALVAPPFTHEIASMPPEVFIEETLLGRCRADRIVVGFDFRFGVDGRGDTRVLAEASRTRGFELEILPAVYHGGWLVSSTRIRDLLEEGRVRLESEMLGRPYDLSGRVVHGYGRGRALGYPTANLQFDPAYVEPASGVYAVLAALEDGRLYPGMMNIGAGPTFADAEHRAEVFLFDYDGETLYDSALRVYFVERLREERKFGSTEELQSRLRVDEKIARALLEAFPGRANPDELAGE